MGFYFVVALRLVTKTTHWQEKAVRMGGLAILLSVFSLFLYTFRENTPGREVKYATTWLDFPSIFNRIVGLNSPGKNISLAEQIKSKIPSEDLALIQDLAKSRSEPVWIYGKNDWAYLILADRRPASTVLPMPYILLKQDLDVLQKKLMQEPEYMFVEKESLVPIGWIVPRFEERYKLIRSGRNLDAYKKR